MSAYVLFNLLNKFGQRDKIRGFPTDYFKSKEEGKQGEASLIVIVFI